MRWNHQSNLPLLKYGRNDPVFFARNFLSLDLHPGQELWLLLSSMALLSDRTGAINRVNALLDVTSRSLPSGWPSHSYLKNVLVPSNRWGKSFCTAVKHLWINFYKLGVKGTPLEIARTSCGTLNLSPHSKQAMAGYDYVEQMVEGTLLWFDGKKVRNNSDTRMEGFIDGRVKQQRKLLFANGSSYQAVPVGDDQASSLAGTRYLYISYDEAAQSLHLQEELPAKIMSRLIDYGGPLDLISTPEVDKPSHQFFFRVAQDGLALKNGWFTMTGKMTDNSFLNKDESKAVLKGIKEIDPIKYRQVAFGEFITTGDRMFDSLAVERIFDSESPSLPKLDRKYVIGIDWGFSDTGDPTVMYVIDWTDSPKYRIVHRESIRGGSPYAVFAHVKWLQRQWNGARIIHDSTALGGVIVSKALREIEVGDMYDFNSAARGKKSEMLFTLQMVLTSGREQVIGEDGTPAEKNPDFGRLRSYVIPVLEEQLGNYRFNPDKGVSDKKLEQDDIMALGMAVWYLERKENRSATRHIRFNPLAPTMDTVFETDSPDNRAIRVRRLDLKEKIIE